MKINLFQWKLFWIALYSLFSILNSMGLTGDENFKDLPRPIQEKVKNRIDALTFSIKIKSENFDPLVVKAIKDQFTQGLRNHSLSTAETGGDVIIEITPTLTAISGKRMFESVVILYLNATLTNGEILYSCASSSKQTPSPKSQTESGILAGQMAAYLLGERFCADISTQLTSKWSTFFTFSLNIISSLPFSKIKDAVALWKNKPELINISLQDRTPESITYKVIFVGTVEEIKSTLLPELQKIPGGKKMKFKSQSHQEITFFLE